MKFSSVVARGYLSYFFTAVLNTENSEIIRKHCEIYTKTYGNVRNLHENIRNQQKHTKYQRKHKKNINENIQNLNGNLRNL